MPIYEKRNDESLKGTELSKYIGTSYILNNKADFEPGRTSDFILKIKFLRDLYDMFGRKVATADEATETLALSIRDFTGPSMNIEPIPIRTGNGIVHYAGVPSVNNSPITFTDYIGKKTEAILLAWYSMCHNVLNDKIGFKEYYAQDGIMYKWAPNGTRQISWLLKGCWINEFNEGQYNRQSPEVRQFSTTIIYDRCEPYTSPDYSSWIVDTKDATSNAKNTAYTQYSRSNYIGTQDVELQN